MPDSGFDWEAGTFVGATKNPVVGFAADWLMYDVTRDLPTTGSIFTPFGNRLFETGWHSKWLTNSNYTSYAQSVLGKSITPGDWARRTSGRLAGEGTGMLGNFYERTIGSSSRFFDVKGNPAAYGEARLATRMGWSFANPFNWGKAKAAAGWGGVALGGSQLVANLFGTAMRLQFSGGALGFNLASTVSEGWARYQMARGESEIGNRSRVDMAPAFYDTRGAATMRQAAMQEIQNTQLNLRSAFGNEASSLHR